MANARKQITITLFVGNPINLIAESSWGGVFPEAEDINKRIRAGDQFITLKGEGKQIHTVRIENIQSVEEIELVEVDDSPEDKTESFDALPF